MTGDTRRRKWRWLRHLAWVLGANFVLLVAGLLIFFGSGAGNEQIQNIVQFFNFNNTKCLRPGFRNC